MEVSTVGIAAVPSIRSSPLLTFKEGLHVGVIIHDFVPNPEGDVELLHPSEGGNVQPNRRAEQVLRGEDGLQDAAAASAPY